MVLSMWFYDFAVAILMCPIVRGILYQLESVNFKKIFKYIIGFFYYLQEKMISAYNEEDSDLPANEYARNNNIKQ